MIAISERACGFSLYMDMKIWSWSVELIVRIPESVAEEWIEEVYIDG